MKVLASDSSKYMADLIPAGVPVVWVTDGGIEDHLTQARTAASVLRALITISNNARKDFGQKPFLLLWRTSDLLSRGLKTAYYGRVVDVRATKDASEFSPEKLVKRILDKANILVVVGEPEQALSDALFSVPEEKEGIIYRLPEVKNQGREQQSLNLTGENYGQYQGYLAMLRPTRISPTQGVQIREIVDYRPKYNL